MVSLADLDKKRIAIVLYRQGERVIFTGVGASASDPALGSVLRVELDAEHHSRENPVFVITAATIEKLVHRRALRGCDYCITFD